jgi:hypothetical protein
MDRNERSISFGLNDMAGSRGGLTGLYINRIALK